MTNSYQIQEVVEMAEKQAQILSDSVASTKSFRFDGDHIVQWSTSEGSLFPKATMSGQLNEYAFTQMDGRLDGPGVKWLDTKIPAPFRNDILNKLVEIRQDESLLLRSRGNSVRAVLSDDYTPFDNLEFLTMLANAIGETVHEVRRVELNDYLRAYVLFPNITIPDPTRSSSSNGYGNGGVKPALYVNNSEIGNGRVRMHAAFYRGSCENGAIYGWSTTGEFTFIHRWISRSILQTNVMSGLAHAMALSETAAKAFFATQEIYLESPKKVKEIINGWATRYGISVEAKDNWLAVTSGQSVEYGRSRSPAVFDIVNGATLVAQGQHPAERETMERMAGDIVQSYALRHVVE